VRPGDAPQSQHAVSIADETQLARIGDRSQAARRVQVFSCRPKLLKNNGLPNARNCGEVRFTWGSRVI